MSKVDKNQFSFLILSGVLFLLVNFTGFIIPENRATVSITIIGVTIGSFFYFSRKRKQEKKKEE